MGSVTNQSQMGMSLVEVLSALVLLTLIIFGMSAIFGSVAGWIKQTRHQTQAVCLAASILEDLRLERDKLDPLKSGKDARELELNLDWPENGMTAEIDLIHPQTSYPNLYDVIVTVTWDDETVFRTLSMSTIIRK